VSSLAAQPPLIPEPTTMASKTFASGIMKIYGNEFNEIWNTGKVLVLDLLEWENSVLTPK
jgi:hypothetical protein